MRSLININQLLYKPDTLSERFHDKTKIRKFPPAEDLNPKNWPRDWKTVKFKGYSRLKEIILPQPKLNNIPFREVLFNRRSLRDFYNVSLTTNSLSTILYFSAGLQKKKSPWIANRSYPSAGARYPLELYLVALKTDINKGLYHYYLRHHSLETIYLFRRFNFRKYFVQTWISKASCLLIVTSIFKRTTTKYGDRGYRYILTEAGHLAQNIYLMSSALNIHCCGIGGFMDDELNKLLDIDGLTESVVYVLAIG